MVSSGPTIPDNSLPSDALAVLVKYDLRVPASVRRHLTDQVPEPPAHAKTQRFARYAYGSGQKNIQSSL